MVKLPMCRINWVRYGPSTDVWCRWTKRMKTLVSKINKSALFDELISIEMHICTACIRQIFESNASNLSLLVVKNYRKPNYKETTKMSANSEEKHEKLWGGRFTSEASALLWKYNASIGLDKEGFRMHALDEAVSSLGTGVTAPFRCE